MTYDIQSLTQTVYNIPIKLYGFKLDAIKSDFKSYRIMLSSEETETSLNNRFLSCQINARTALDFCISRDGRRFILFVALLNQEGRDIYYQKYVKSISGLENAVDLYKILVSYSTIDKVIASML